MPPVVVAVGAAVAGAAASAGVGAAVAGSAFAAGVAGSIGISAATVGLVVGGIVGTIVAAGVQYAGAAILGTGKQKNSSANTAAAQASTTRAAQDRRQLVRSSVEPRAIVYGRARVSGPLVYASSSGEDLRFLHLVVPIAGHRINAMRAVWIGDQRIDESQIDVGQGGIVGLGPLAGKVRVRRYLGNQLTADPDLASESTDGWSGAHVLRGISYLYLRLEYDAEVFPNGLQNISVEVEGKSDIFDPRMGVTAYTANAALCILDYLRSPMGLACADDEIDLPSFIAAANICDEAVQIDAGGTLANRYRLGGAFGTDRAPIAIMEDMLAACAGTLVYVAGRYRLHVGAYTAPTDTLTASDLAGLVEVVTKPPRRERFNAVRGTFLDPDRGFQAADFPPVSEAAYQIEDGEVIWTDLELPTVNFRNLAERLALMALRRHREGITVRVPVQFRGIRYAVWQTLSVTLPDLGWSGKVFRITAWAYDPTSGIVTLTLAEESAFSYAWQFDPANAIGPAPDTNLVSPFDVPAPGGLTMTEELYVAPNGRGVSTRARLSWQAVPHPFVRGYEVQRRLASATTWQDVATTQGALEAAVDDVPEGLYAWRVRASTIYGRGRWAEVQARVGALLAQPPAAVTGFQVQATGGLAYVSWTQHPDLDVRFGGQIEFRHAPQTTGATWAASTGIGSAVPGANTFAVLPLLPGTYFAKATDSGGRYSSAAAAAVAQQATAVVFTPITSVTEHPGFSGAKTGTVAVSSTLRLDSAGLIDSVASMDALADLDALGGVLASGSYNFASGIDLGSVRNCRLTRRMAAAVVNTLDQIDARAQPVDAWLDFDGVAGNEADAWIEVRQTDDNPSGSPVWGPWRRLDASEFRARAFQFRVQMLTRDAAFNLHISELSVSADEVI
jgi:hypothetical protein